MQTLFCFICLVLGTVNLHYVIHQDGFWYFNVVAMLYCYMTALKILFTE